jgi:hypothetical protein
MGNPPALYNQPRWPARRIYIERNHNLQPASVSYSGSYNFKVDGNGFLSNGG